MSSPQQPQQHPVPHPQQGPQPGVYYVQVPAKPWSGAAITGFVLSLLWGFGVLSLFGAVVAGIGIADTSGGAKRGRALAWWGLALGLLGAIGLVWMFAAGIVGAFS